MRKKKMMGNEQEIQFEMVGIPDVLVQQSIPSRSAVPTKHKSEAFTVDIKSQKPDKVDTKQARRSKAERENSQKKNLHVFGSDFEILVSEKDISKIEQRKQKQEQEQAVAFAKYKDMIENSIVQN